MANLDAARPRRLAGWPGLRNFNIAFGLLVGLAALVVIGQARAPQAPAAELLIVTADLPPGTTLTAAHLGATGATLDARVAAGYLRRDEAGQVIGQVLRERAHADGLLRRDQLGGPAAVAPDQVETSVPVRPETAVGGALRAGDRVVVVQARPDRTETILPRARILEVRPGLVVTFALTQAEADAVQSALTRGNLQLYRLPESAGAGERP
jgi:hypothetical protein